MLLRTVKKNKLKKMMGTASPKLTNRLGFRNSWMEKVGVLCLPKRKSSERLTPRDLLENKNSLYLSDGKRGPPKDKTKTNKLDWKQEGIRQETETAVLILRHKIPNSMVKELS